MIENILVSGMMRSGTTLLQRALDAHPKVGISYQSNTVPFIDMKKRFLDQIGKPQYLALAHYNPSPGYSLSEFVEWLRKQPGLVSLSRPSGNEAPADVRLVGVKEVLVEEFYPALLEQGVHCLNIIRDPRDVIASMSFGDGFVHTGKQRPVLFDLRNWRKSVHIAHRLRQHDKFMSIRFEDLIQNTGQVLHEVFRWLDVEALSIEEVEREMSRSQWAGNSSFGDKKAFDKRAVRNYPAVMPGQVIEYIEAVCWPEMRQLGYRPQINQADRARIINKYTDPFVVKRAEFDANYSCQEENVQYELNRLRQDFAELNKGIFV